MKALVIRAFGGPEVLEHLDWPAPRVDVDEGASGQAWATAGHIWATIDA